MSVVVMPCANRMSYIVSTTQFDIEHDEKSPRTTSQSDTLKQEAAFTLSTKNDTTAPKAERNHIKVGSSMILNLQRAYPFHKTTCCDLLLKGYLRTHHKHLLSTLPLDIYPLLIDYLDPLLKWVLEQSEPKLLLTSWHRHRSGSSKELQYDLFLRKNDWKRCTVAMKYIVHDVLLSESDFVGDGNDEHGPQSTPYSITILQDSHIGSNLIDIQWLCQMVSTNLALRSLRISKCKHLLEFNKFHFLLQNAFLMEDSSRWENLEEISIDSYAPFNDECFKLLLAVIEQKCPALSTLKLYRTAIGNESVKELLAFLEKERSRDHPLWNIDIEFCPQIDDDALRMIWHYLQRHPLKHIYVKCTRRHLLTDQLFEDQRLSISVYPT